MNCLLPLTVAMCNSLSLYTSELCRLEAKLVDCLPRPPELVGYSVLSRTAGQEDCGEKLR